MKKILAIMLVSAAGMCSAAANDNTNATRAATDKAAADYKTAKAQCDSMSGNAKTICINEARVARARAEADAVANNTASTPRARTRAQVAAVDAEYALERAKCNDQTGDDKAKCMNDAKASHTAALADARAGRMMAGTTPSDAMGTSGTTAGTSDTTGTSGTAGTTGTSGTTGTTGTSGTTGTTGSADTTAERAGQATTRAGETIADAAITTRVKADLVRDPDLSAMGIHVETNKGVVMLSGFVNSKAEADKAVRLARSVDGVKKVESAIKVNKAQ